MFSWISNPFKKPEPCAPEIQEQLLKDAMLILDRISALEIMYSEPVPNSDVGTRLRRLCRTYQDDVEAHRAKEKRHGFRALRSDIEDRLATLRKNGPGKGLRVAAGEINAVSTSS